MTRDAVSLLPLLRTARLYSVPDVPPPVFVSGFGEKAIKLAARIADGFFEFYSRHILPRLRDESA